MSLNPLDIAFTIAVIILVLRAGFRGFVREFMMLASLVLSIGVAALFSGTVSDWIEYYLGPSMWNHVIAFLGLFLAVYLLTKLTESFLNTLVERIHLNSLDHALGLFFGCIEGILMVFIAILLLRIQPIIPVDNALERSLYSELLGPLIPYAGSLVR